MADDIPTSDERKAFGLRLRRNREALGLTQPDVGRWLTDQGIDATKQAVSAWELGRNLPDAMIIKRLCRLFNCSADSLLWETHAETPGATNPLAPALLSRIANLTVEQQTAIERNLVTLLDVLAPAPHATTATKQRNAA